MLKYQRAVRVHPAVTKREHKSFTREPPSHVSGGGRHLAWFYVPSAPQNHRTAEAHVALSPHSDLTYGHEDMQGLEEKVHSGRAMKPD